MGKLNFTPFSTLYRTHLSSKNPIRGVATEISMNAFYEGFPEVARKLYQSALDSGELTQARAQYLLESDIYLGSIERKWHAAGAPAYKIWPGMLDAVIKTTLEFDSAMFEMPFPTFSVELPRKMLRENENSPYAVSLLVTVVHDKAGKGLAVEYPDKVAYREVAAGRKLIVVTSFENDLGGIMTKFSLTSGKTVEEEFRDLFIGEKFDQAYWASKEMTRKLVTIAISTALIGVGANPLLVKKSAITAKDQIRRRKWARKKGVSALGDPQKGFSIGADIRLPGRAKKRYKSREGEGQQLSWGHFRTGHLQRVRYKNEAGEWRFRVTFIPHLRVRPDLKLKPKATDRSIRS